MDELRQLIPLLIPLLLIQLILLIIALVDLIKRQHVKFLPKWAWTLIILFFSYIGPIAYLMIGREEA